MAVAFCAGAGATWLVLNPHGAGTHPTQPPTYVISQSTPTGQPPLPPSSVPAMAPDVSQQSPGQAAVTQGNASYDQKNWAGAIEDYRRAISLGTDNPDVRTDLGNALRFSGEPQKALEQYQTAQRQDPQHENSLYNMATLYSQELHDPAAALRAMQEYLLRFPTGDKASIARQFIGQSGTNTVLGN
jgi:Tfp pilus assembly protein PilF